jgi:hypothetical protein
LPNSFTQSKNPAAKDLVPHMSTSLADSPLPSKISSAPKPITSFFTPVPKKASSLNTVLEDTEPMQIQDSNPALEDAASMQSQDLDTPLEHTEPMQIQESAEQKLGSDSMENRDEQTQVQVSTAGQCMTDKLLGSFAGEDLCE